MVVYTRYKVVEVLKLRLQIYLWTRALVECPKCDRDIKYRDQLFAWEQRARSLEVRFVGGG